MEEIKRIQLFGERCSGTNYLESLLVQNLEGVTLCRDFGHKHFYHQPGVRQASDCLFIVIYRELFDWLRSLHQQPYHAAPELRNISFSEFIRKPWWCVWNEEADKTPDDSLYGSEMMFERNPHSGERFRNVMRLRSAKIRNWESLRQKTPHHFYLNYEMLKDAPDTFIETMADVFNLTTKDEFVNVEGYRGSRAKYQPKTYDAIQPEDYRYIMQHTDLELEKKIGYEIVGFVDEVTKASPDPDHV